MYQYSVIYLRRVLFVILFLSFVIRCVSIKKQPPFLFVFFYIPYENKHICRKTRYAALPALEGCIFFLESRAAASHTYICMY